MAGEQIEELGLVVSLDDNASAQLQQIKQNLGGLREIAKLQRSTLDLGEDLKKLTEQLRENAEGMKEFAESAGWAGIAFVQLGEMAERTGETLKELFVELTEMDQSANLAGVAVGQMRANAEAFERAGFTLSGGIRQWTKWRATFTDSQYEFSEFWKKMYEGIRAGSPQAARLDRLRREMQGVSPEQGFNLFRAYTEEVRKQIERAGRSGAQEQARLFKAAHLDVRAQFVEPLKVLTAKQLELEEKRAETVRRYRVAQTRLEQEFTKIKRNLSVNTMTRLIIPITKLAKAIPRLTAVAKKRKISWFTAITPMAYLIEQLWKRFGPQEESKEPSLKDQLGKGDLDRMKPETLREGMSLKDMQPQRLLGGGQQLLDGLREQERNASELQRQRNLLLGAPDGLGGTPPEFHNQPMGGARGESNPIKLPAGVKQPGGGAAAEARDPVKDAFNALNVEALRKVSSASGSSITQLGAQATGSNVFTFKEVVSDPEVRRKFDPATVQMIQEAKIFGVSEADPMTGISAGLAFDPNQPTAAGTLGHEAGHIGRAMAIARGRSDPNIFKRYGFGLEAMRTATAEGREFEEAQQRRLDLEVAPRLLQKGVISEEVAATRMSYAEIWLNQHPNAASQVNELARHERMIESKAREMLGSSFTPPGPSAPRARAGMGGLPIGRQRREEIDRGEINDVLVKEIRQNGEGEVNVKVSGPEKQSEDAMQRPPYKDTGTQVPTRAKMADATTKPFGRRTDERGRMQGRPGDVGAEKFIHPGDIPTPEDLSHRMLKQPSLEQQPKAPERGPPPIKEWDTEAA